MPNSAFRTTIQRLFGFCRPSKVVRLVVTMIVDSIKRVASRWPWAEHSINVRRKGGEVINPPSMDLYPSSSIVDECMVVRVETSSFDVNPRLIQAGRFSMLRSRFGLSMSRPNDLQFVSSETSARRCLAISDRFSTNGDFSAAFAPTQPRRKSVNDPVPSHDRQTAKCLSSQIDEVRHEAA